MSASDEVAYVELGTTGLRVSKICFGTSGIGDLPNTYGYTVDEERALETVRAIFDGPVNTLDTSRNYGLGRSEERIGKVIRERGGLPEGFVLSTKLDRDMETLAFDAARARRSLEESLETLGLDRVQLLHLHDPEHAASLDGITGPDGAIRELFRMKEEGLADAVGLAAGRVDIMTPLLKAWDFDVMITHNRFTLTNRNAEAMIDLAVARGTAVINGAPYASGILAKGSASNARWTYQTPPDEVRESVRLLEDLSARHGVPMGAAALQFSLRDPRIAVTLCGITMPKRVADTLVWANWPIEQAYWDELATLPVSLDDPEANRIWDAG